MSKIEIRERPLAFVDVETTGLDPRVNDIVDLAVITVDQDSIEELHRYNTRVMPPTDTVVHEKAVEVNGFDREVWQKSNALPLETAMKVFSEVTREAIMVAHNITFDWSFIEEAFRKTGIDNHMDYHRIDMFTLAWSKLYWTNIQRFNLKHICEYIGIGEEPEPHRAINGAEKILQVYRELI